MPTPVPIADDTGGTLLDRVLGPSSRQRSLKTFIPNTGIGASFGVLENHAKRLRNVFERLHRQANPGEGKALTGRALAERYHCILTYEEFHLGQLEHLASLKGFSLRASLGRATDDDAAPPPSTIANQPNPSSPSPSSPATGMKMA